MSKITTRFAPSPTGYIHIGSARTALFAYLHAKQSGGNFILRIEDTDKSREVEGAIQHIKDSLHWLGLEWDFGPDIQGPFGSCVQSERLDVYMQYATKLYEQGLAYPDTFTPEEISDFRKDAEEKKVPFLMRNYRPTKVATWDGKQPLRFKVPEIKRYEWQDMVRGTLSAGEEMLDDFIIIKADGYPTYNFAHIIDDYEMGVTHVMRGDEFISSTPKFLSLHDALGIPYPHIATLPPIMAPDKKKKLGKRDGAKDLLDYKRDGILSVTMVNFLALIGWNPGTPDEFFDMSELFTHFSLDKIQKSGGAFNEEKLLWLNKHYLQQLTEEDFYQYVQTGLSPESKSKLEGYENRLRRLLPTIQERTQAYSDIENAAQTGEYDFLITLNDNYPNDLLLWKDDNYETTRNHLKKARDIFASTDFSSREDIKEALWEYAETVGKGSVLWPLRVALTAKKQSPDPFTCAFAIGQKTTLERIDIAITKLTG